MQGWQWYSAVVLTNPNHPTGETWCGTDVQISVLLDATVQHKHVFEYYFKHIGNYTPFYLNFSLSVMMLVNICDWHSWIQMHVRVFR